MTTYNRTIVSFAATLLTSLSASAVQATAVQAAAERPTTTITSKPGGFILASNRHAPGPYAGKDIGYVEGLCAVAKRRAGWNCPVNLPAPVSGPGDISAGGLAHLRLNMVVREMRNDVIAGSGVSDMSYAVIKIKSTAASASIPAGVDPGVVIALPGPGVISDVTQYAITPFKAIITNGCLGAAANFDLTLDGAVHPIGDDVNATPTGEIHLVDAVNGHGYYNFKFTIPAIDGNGNLSNFTFSGDADSFCTASMDISK